MYSITKTFYFDAAHRLVQLLEGHKCRNLHGHTWRVDVTIKSKNVNEETGFVIDFGELKFIKEWLDVNFDHAVIVSELDTELINFLKKLKTKTYIFPGIVSAENIAKFLAEEVIYPTISLMVDAKITVSVWETPTSKATYRSE